MAKKEQKLTLSDLSKGLQENKLAMNPAIQAQIEAAMAAPAPDEAPVSQKSSKADTNLSALNSNIVKLGKTIELNTKVLDSSSKITKGKGPTGPSDLSEKDIETQKTVDYQTELLEQIEENTREGKSKAGAGEEAPAEKPFSKVGLIGTLIAGALGIIAGVLVGQAKAMLATFKVLSKLIPQNLRTAVVNAIKSIPQLINDIITKVMINIRYAFNMVTDVFKNKFPKAFSFVEKAISGFATFFRNIISFVETVFGKIAEAFKFVKTLIVNFFKPIGEGLKLIKEGSAVVSGGVGKVFSMINGVKEFFTGIGKWLGGFSKVFSGFFKIAGKLAYPITIIMGLFDGVTEAIKGYEEGGILGGIQGFLTGVLNSIIGSFLDLIKNVVSWVLGALGFEDAEKFLDSFSFSDMIKDFIDAIFHPIDTMKTLFAKIGEWFAKFEIPKFKIPLIGEFGPWKPFAGVANTAANAAKTGGDVTASAAPVAVLPETANKVYKQSAENKEADKKVAQPKSSTVITAPTQVNNQTQNAFVKTPIRNTDNTVNRYMSMAF